MKQINYSKILTKESLYQEYIVNKKTILQIANEMVCSSTTVWKYLKKHNIPIRSKSEAMQGSNNKYHHILTKEFLYKEYIVNKKSIKTIAKEINSSCKPVYMALKRYNIKIRNKFEQNYGKNNGNWNDGITKKQHYCIDCLKQGIKTKISPSTVYGGGRCHSCAKKTLYKDPTNHPNWKNGISFEPYPIGWTKILKESIRERDNHQCQICGKSTKKNGRKLDVHHIDYDKENLNPDNLIALCQSCHSKSNYNRETYIEFFQILKEAIK